MKIIKFLLWTIFIVILDQYTKHLVLHNIEPGSSIEIIPGLFNIVLTFNKGVAFGLMSGLSDTLRLGIISLTALAAFVLLSWLYFHNYKSSCWHSLSLAFILGGAIGNILDRILKGAVTDFLDFHYQSYHWPAFNVADSAICVGVVLLLVLPEKR